MSGVFYYKEFNDQDLGDDESPLRKKFNTIIKDLEENNHTSQGDIKLIKGAGNIKYFRAKLSNSDRLLFTSIKHNNKDAFVLLEVISNHDYQKSQFLTNKEKVKNIHIVNQSDKEISYNADEIDASQAHWFGKLITFSTTQEDIVKRAEESKLPLVVSGAAGSGKTSVALESLKKMQEKCEGGKILYITKSENLIKESKKIFEYEYYDETAGEFKIGAPEEIEFLFLHEFLEKRAENIKGKKPIDRSKFFLWFKKMCEKSEFKRYENEGDKIFEEFTAVIAGKVLLKGDSYGKDQYRKLGKRESIFPEKERDSIYDFFKEYRKFIEEDPKYYDSNLIARECTEEKIYDAVIVDEVQDLTESTLGLILRSLKDESKRNFLLCGDVNQVVHPSFFSQAKLKSFLCQSKYIRNQKLEAFYTLEKNYRNSEQVIEVANRILHFKNYCFGPEDTMTPDEKKAFFMKSDTKKAGNVSLIAKDEEQKEIGEKVSSSTNWAILVLDNEKKEGACKLFDTPLVFNIHEAKGLEFENVILYKFFSNEAYNQIWNRVCTGKDPKKIEEAIKKVRNSYQSGNVKGSQLKDKEDKSSEKYKFYMNALYVGVSRAIDGIYIMDDEEKCNLLKAIKSKKVASVDIKKNESTLEEWKSMALELIDKGNIEQVRGVALKLIDEEGVGQARDIALKLIDKGNIEQAESIEKKLQEKGKKEHAEEITNALRAKEYCKEQATSELKTEPRGSSIKVPKNEKSQGKKHKLHPNEQRKLEKNTEELFSALKNGNLQLAKKLIEQGINVNAKIEEDLTLLHIAALGGCKDVVELLLNRGAEIKDRDNNGNTALHIAAVNGHKDVVELLLNRGAEVKDKDIKGATPLYVAAFKGHKDVVELLLNRGAEVKDKGSDGKTPLYVAAVRGYKDVVELLLKYGVDVNVKTKEGLTPLDIAEKLGHKNIVELLRKYTKKSSQPKDGLDENYLNKKKTLTKRELEENTKKLLSAVDNGNLQLVKELINQGVDVNDESQTVIHSIILATVKGYNDIVGILIDSGVDVNAKTKSGLNDTLLHSAADLGNISVVKLLLKNVVDVNAKNNQGFTPLQLAVQKGYTNIVRLLLDSGAEFNTKNIQGCTPLHTAIFFDRSDIVGLLLERAADINAKTKEGYTSLMIAEQRGNEQIIGLLTAWKASANEKKKLSKKELKENTEKLFSAVDNDNLQLAAQLIRQGVNINATDEYDATLLQVAVQKCRNNIIQLLLENGVDIDATTTSCGDTPLQVAAYSGDSDIVQLLLERGAKVDATKHDYTPLHYVAMADEGDKDGVVALLLKHGADVNAKTKEGLTPLDIAEKNGNKNIVELLRKYTKENPQSKSDLLLTGESKTLAEKARKHKDKKLQGENQEKINTQELICALRTCDLQLAEDLIKKKGCTLENSSSGIRFLRGDEGRVILDALQYGFLGVAGLLLQYDSDHGKSISLNWALGEYRNDIARLLNGMASAKYGKETPLHEAAQKGKKGLAHLHKCVVKLLIEHRAAINYKDDDDKNWTILHAAAQKDDEYIVQLLIDNGADVNAKTKEGFTPLNIAEKNGNKNVVELLCKYTKEKPQLSKLEQGISKKNKKLEENTNMLFLAFKEGMFELVESLIVEGVNVNAKDQEGFTPLHLAVKTVYKDAAQLFQKRGAQVFSFNTPIPHLATKRRECIVSLLLKHGADVNAKTKKGLTPLDIAEKNGNKNIVELLRKYTKENPQPKSNLHDASISLEHLAQARGS